MSGQSPNAASHAPSLTAQLATRLARPVGADDRRRAAKHVLDWTGCAVAGARTKTGTSMRDGLGEDADPHRDVMYFGALGNILEMDDVDKRALLHPGPVVIPAALVAAIDADADAAAFLDAVVRGYEAVIRIGRAVGPAHYRYWHNTGTCGPFGAAAAAASIYGLDTEHMVEALGLAGTQASGFWQTRHEAGSMAKQVHTARAAHSGWLAATLARAGVVGVRAILEGPQGFFAATCGEADPRAVVDDDADAPWAIHDVSFKPWPACRHAHAAMDAARALRDAAPQWREAEAFTVRTYEDAIVFCDKPAPSDTASAKFSLQHAVAIALLRDTPRLEDFEPDALRDPAVAALRARISLEQDDALTRAYPARFGAALSAQMPGGERLEAAAPDALGDPENPLSDAGLRDKAAMLLRAGGLDAGAANRLRDAALRLGDDEGDGLHRYLTLLIDGALA